MRITIAKLLRLRSTIGNEIAAFTARAHKVASRTLIDNAERPADFKFEESVTSLLKSQARLRTAKITAVTASVNTTVLVPEFDKSIVPEAGKRVPVYQAVLIRDDLKNYRKFVEQVLLVEESDRQDRVSPYEQNSPIRTTSVRRNFNFTEYLELSAKLQEWIDEMDGIVQGTDATTHLEVDLG